MNPHQMRARQAEIATEMRAINTQHQGALPPEAEARWNTLQTELTDLEARIARQEQLNDNDRRSGGNRVGGGAAQTETRQIGGFSVEARVPESFDGLFLQTQQGQFVPVLENRHRMADCVRESETAADRLGYGGFLRVLVNGGRTREERAVLNESAIGSGGALVPPVIAAGVLDELRANSVAFRAGCRTIPMSSQSQTYTRLTKTPVGAWRAESGAIVEDASTFDQVTLKARSWALRCRITRELLEDGQNVDSIIRSAFAASGALALDQAILFGDGTANQPLGIANTPGVQSMNTSGALANWDPILDGVLDLENVNAGTVSAMIMAPRTNRTIRGFKDTTGNPLSAPSDLASIPRLTTTSVPVNEGADAKASSIILGDFSQVYVGMRTSLQISVLNELYAENGEIGFIAWMRADVLVVRPQTLLRIGGITA